MHYFKEKQQIIFNKLLFLSNNPEPSPELNVPLSVVFMATPMESLLTTNPFQFGFLHLILLIQI